MLTGKRVFVTGSSRGIGAATARLAKKYGAEVVIHGRNYSEPLRRVAEELGARCVVFDVTREEEVKENLSTLGNIDVLVNNAGVNPSKTFEELTTAEWQSVFNTNFFGATYVTRVVLEGMLHQGHGAIVNVASVKGLNSVVGKPAYAASKAALIRLTSSLAEEYADRGIRVNAVAPGFVLTEMTQATISEAISKQIDQIPMKRLGTSEEIAEAVIFLASEQARYITGQCLVVDGGLSIV